MKLHNVTQGTSEWKALRLGIPTASEAHRLVKKDMRKKDPIWERSTSDALYLAQCLAECIIGYPLDEGSSQWMERGTEEEEAAVAWYEIEHGVEVERVGFITNDAETFGCSPDGTIYENEGLEIKVPSAVNHVAYMLQPESFYAKYKVQVQASLWVTGFRLWNLVSYNSVIAPVVYPVTPDEGFAEAFAPILETFTRSLEAYKADYRKKHGEPERVEPEADPLPDDAATILEHPVFSGDDGLPF